ncbi:MAG: hypothetical protein KA369_03395 [Spirochaetes bacterium]|nr:hypothetical protein [Spirochaetota bacterium]
MAKKDESFNNLIDEYLKMVEDPNHPGGVGGQFNRLLTDYFFINEKNENRTLEQFLEKIEPPEFLGSAKSIFDMDIENLRGYVRGPSTGESLAGKIMLSQQYLKSFYPHHAPAFNKLPEDVRFELMDAIKDKNETIITAFEKMMSDRDADRKRKVLTLIALIIKNIHYRSGIPLNKLPKNVEEIIRETFLDTDEIFTASQKQMADLLDNTKIKQLVKTFFMVKQFKDITGIAEMFIAELERYRKRTIAARI